MTGDDMVTITPAQLSKVRRRQLEASGAVNSRRFFHVTDEFSDKKHPLKPTLEDPSSPDSGDEDAEFLNEQQEALISERIKSRTRELGLRRAEVAAALGVSTRTVTTYVSKPGKLRYVEACKLAELLKLTPEAMRCSQADMGADAVPHDMPVTVSDAYSLLGARDRARVDDYILRLAGKVE